MQESGSATATERVTARCRRAVGVVVGVMLAGLMVPMAATEAAASPEVADTSCVYASTPYCPAAVPETFVGFAGGYFTSSSFDMAVTADGRVFSGGAELPGLEGVHLDGPIVAAATCFACSGYWLAGADGGVFTFNQRTGHLGFYGSLAGRRLNARIVAIASTPAGHGYWLVGADGGVFSFGDAGFYGSLGDVRLNAPIVAISPSGRGYLLVGADGGVFAFGDARFSGSLAAVHLQAPIVGIASKGDAGYWLVGADGGTFAFGGLRFTGSFVDAAASLGIRAVGALVAEPPRWTTRACASWPPTATSSASRSVTTD
jgi:hypothetical protein